MASNIGDPVDGTHFTLLTEDVLPKNTSDNKLITTTETSKTDEVGEDDVFASENETSRGVGNFPKKNKETAADNNQQSTKNENNQKVNSQISAVIISSPPQQQETLTVSSISDGNHVPTETTPPTSVVPTTRRPSYTSKAPSALTNLPKIEDINNTSPILQNQTYVTLHTSSSLPRGGSTSLFESEELRPINKDLLSLHGQASFDSVDHEEYSNPGTPPSISTVSGGQRHREKSSNRMRADVLSKGKWESAARSNVLTVRCREQIAELHKDKFGSGSKGKCIQV